MLLVCVSSLMNKLTNKLLACYRGLLRKNDEIIDLSQDLLLVRNQASRTHALMHCGFLLHHTLASSILVAKVKWCSAVLMLQTVEENTPALHDPIPRFQLRWLA